MKNLSAVIVTSIALQLIGSAQAEDQLLRLSQIKGLENEVIKVFVDCLSMKVGALYELSAFGGQIQVCNNPKINEELELIVGRVGVYNIDLLVNSGTHKSLNDTIQFEAIAKGNSLLSLSNPLVIGALLSSFTFILNQLITAIIESFRRRGRAIEACRAYAEEIRQGVNKGKIVAGNVPKAPFEISKLIGESGSKILGFGNSSTTMLMNVWKLERSQNTTDALELCDRISPVKS